MQPFQPSVMTVEPGSMLAFTNVRFRLKAQIPSLPIAKYQQAGG
jgi:hypothetical protein